MNKQYDAADFDRIGDWTIARLVKEEHEKKKFDQEEGTDTSG